MLTGLWIGRFSYDQPGFGKPVAFEVTLHEVNGSLTGHSTEPNSFRPEPFLSLNATITGWREGGNMGWRKTYTTFVQADSPAYSGVINPDETRIWGTWSFPLAPWFTGSFTMSRAPQTSASVKREKAAPVPMGRG